ncbi:MAG: chemotaxis response regulator protein-glutamate methylesterase [Candidatus Kryptonium sp.]
MRKLISDLLRKDEEIEIVAQASNGREAIEKAKQCKPDVITLDIEMPEMDGLTALRFLRSEVPQAKVIMFSSLTQEGAKATLEALSLGAYDFVPKPSTKSFLESVKKIESDLVPKIKSVTIPKEIKGFKPNIQTTRLRPGIYRALGIGVSTGGPQTLMEIFKNIPSTLKVPVFVVQHMPPLFTRQLAERLDKISPLTVKEAEHGEQVKEGFVYIAPGDYHMKVVANNRDKVISLTKDSPVNNCRPAVDVLFETLAETYNGTCLAIVLTGMGRDGTDGARKIKQKGGGIIAQDAQSSVVFGMPRAVIEAGLADEILSLQDIPKRIRELFKV